MERREGERRQSKEVRKRGRSEEKQERVGAPAATSPQLFSTPGFVLCSAPCRPGEPTRFRCSLERQTRDSALRGKNADGKMLHSSLPPTRPIAPPLRSRPPPSPNESGGLIRGTYIKIGRERGGRERREGEGKKETKHPSNLGAPASARAKNSCRWFVFVLMSLLGKQRGCDRCVYWSRARHECSLIGAMYKYIY